MTDSNRVKIEVAHYAIDDFRLKTYHHSFPGTGFRFLGPDGRWASCIGDGQRFSSKDAAKRTARRLEKELTAEDIFKKLGF